MPFYPHNDEDLIAQIVAFGSVFSLVMFGAFVVFVAAPIAIAPYVLAAGAAIVLGLAALLRHLRRNPPGTGTKRRI